MFVELTPPLWWARLFSRTLQSILPSAELHGAQGRPGTGIAVTFEMPEESDKAQLEALLAQLPKL